ncbi:unnamed protein product [Durusdinium trenchii]|uniref:Calpain catalytic domain-containing protein n=1 Tax=Durusdinium trenchii TaxID=1381693 RepID=A0ABP0SWT4_9DINO
MKRHYGEVHANQYSKKSCIGPKSWRSCHAQTDRTDFPSSAEIFSARKPWRYNYRSSSRSHFTGIEDDLTDAFVDAEFPHETASIGESSTSFKCGTADTWVRARMLGDPAECCLFEEVRPQDVKQGSLGDCWLMSALSCLADHPQKLKSLFSTKHITKDGKYDVYLWDLEKEEWVAVTIDEFLPCNISCGQPMPAFAKPLGEEIWVPLLELLGVRKVLTGKSDVVSYTRQKDTTWRRRHTHRKNQLKRGAGWNLGGVEQDEHLFDCRARNPRASSWTWKSKAPTIDKEKLFGVLQGHCADKHVLGCSIAGNSSGAEEAKGNGLYTKHVYSLLKVLDEQTDDGTPVKLVKLRNPWGYKEWKGDWADQCDGEESKWKDVQFRPDPIHRQPQTENRVEWMIGMWATHENPQLAERLSNTKKNDGCFFMSFDDWAAAFTCVSLCPVGVAPVPPAEEDPEDEDVAEDGKSDSEEDPRFDGPRPNNRANSPAM